MKLPLSAVVLTMGLGLARVGHTEPTEAAASAPAPSTYVRERERYLDDRRGFLSSLLLWGGANVVMGLPLTASSRDPFVQWVGAQTVAWGAVNSAIAIVGLATTGSVRHDLGTLEAVAAERKSIQRFLWINVAFDFAYATAGALLYGLGDDPGLRGNGAAILGQGLFLVGFDLVGSFTQGPH